jgi:hypothetical protein
MIDRQLMDAEIGTALVVLAAASVGVMIFAIVVGIEIMKEARRRKEQGK